MTILQTVAVYVGSPLAIYAVIALLTVVPARARRRARYRPDQSWDYSPRWWAGDTPVARLESAATAVGTEGGARGTW